LEALKLMISGGVVPGGYWRSTVWEIAVIWALAVSRRAFGCRYTLMMACPFTVVDSMRWMLSTLVVSTRSYEVVIRPSSSSVFSPLYCQATAMTGMLIAGKMSVGVRVITTGLAIRISSARTTKVYGRSRATRTIHIGARAYVATAAVAEAMSVGPSMRPV